MMHCVQWIIDMFRRQATHVCKHAGLCPIPVTALVTKGAAILSNYRKSQGGVNCGRRGSQPCLVKLFVASFYYHRTLPSVHTTESMT